MVWWVWGKDVKRNECIGKEDGRARVQRLCGRLSGRQRGRAPSSDEHSPLLLPWAWGPGTGSNNSVHIHRHNNWIQGWVQFHFQLSLTTNFLLISITIFFLFMHFLNWLLHSPQHCLVHEIWWVGEKDTSLMWNRLTVPCGSRCTLVSAHQSPPQRRSPRCQSSHECTLTLGTCLHNEKGLLETELSWSTPLAIT